MASKGGALSEAAAFASRLKVDPATRAHSTSANFGEKQTAFCTTPVAGSM